MNKIQKGKAGLIGFGIILLVLTVICVAGGIACVVNFINVQCLGIGYVHCIRNMELLSLQRFQKRENALVILFLIKRKKVFQSAV